MISKDPLIVDALAKPLKKNQLTNKINEIINFQLEMDEELDVIFRPFEDDAPPAPKEKPEPLPEIEPREQLSDKYTSEALEAAGINEFMNCCFSGDYLGLQKALNKNPDGSLKTRSLDGKSCIHYGARGGNTELIDFLLASGLKINDRDKKGREPLYEAVHANDIEMCKHLIACGARINSKFDEKTYLMVARLLTICIYLNSS